MDASQPESSMVPANIADRDRRLSTTTAELGGGTDGQMVQPGIGMQIQHPASSSSQYQVAERQQRAEQQITRIQDQVVFLAQRLDRTDYALMQQQQAQMNQSQSRQPIIIQNHASSNVENQAPPPIDPYAGRGGPILGGFLETFLDDVRYWWRSPLNKFCVYCGTGLALYLWQQRLQHSWRLSEIQRRIDANIVLKLSQWFGKHVEM